MMNPTERFTNRVDDYVAVRPSYPPALLDALVADYALTPAYVIADIGSGTGILTRLFPDHGNIVYGIKPNAAMRQELDEQAPAMLNLDADGLADDRLRLIFTCCHPVLASEARVALTLRAVCGLTTEEIARAFLVAPATLAQRIVRAKAKIRDAILAGGELGNYHLAHAARATCCGASTAIDGHCSSRIGAVRRRWDAACC